MTTTAIVVLYAGECLAAGPTFSAGVQTGTLQNAAITEASGLVASHTNVGVLWTHNDSGDTARIFPTTAAGTNLGTYSIAGAGATDWEDMALGPGPTAGVSYLYMGDIGDNAEGRAGISVYRVPEPAVSALQSPTNVSVTGAQQLRFVYPDGVRNAESMFVDPLTRDIYIVTKFDAPKRVYRAAYPQSTSLTTTLEFVTSFPTASSWLTAADISPDGDEIIVRSTGETSGRMYVRPPGGSIADAFASTPFSIPLHDETQGEAIAFDAAGLGYYTVSEGASSPIYYFDRVSVVPEPGGAVLAGLAAAAAGLLRRGRRIRVEGPASRVRAGAASERQIR